MTLKLFANNAPIFRIDINRTIFVERKTTVDFTDGVVTSVRVEKPSEALAFAQLPLKIVNAVVSAPVDAVTERKALRSAEASVLNAEANDIRTKTEILRLSAAQGATNGDINRLGAFGPRSAQANGALAARCQNYGFDDLVFCRQFLESN